MQSLLKMLMLLQTTLAAETHLADLEVMVHSKRVLVSTLPSEYVQTVPLYVLQKFAAPSNVKVTPQCLPKVIP
jgi:hypothetical protein